MIIAVALSHEAVYLPLLELKRPRLLLTHHYGKAVALLTRNDSLQAIEIILITCSLFFDLRELSRIYTYWVNEHKEWAEDLERLGRRQASNAFRGLRP